MELGNHKLFNNKKNLYNMVNLRLNGWSSTSLGVLFGCDHRTIEQCCDRYWIKPINKVFTLESIIKNVLSKVSNPNYAEHIAESVLQTYSPVIQWEEDHGKRYALGRSYKEYLADSR